MKRVFLLATCAALAATAAAQAPAQAVPAAETSAPAERNASLAELFEAYDKGNLSQSPMSKSYRGIRDEDYGTWDNFTDAGDIAYQQRLQATARTMRALFDPASLSAQDSLSFRLFDRMAERSAAAFPYRHLGYVFDQMNGYHSDLPAFLINIHSIENEEQAKAYVSRILTLGPALDQLTAEARERTEKGVMPPRWV